jgi:hypothetical protein
MTLIDANPDGLHALPGVVTHVVTVPELGLVYTSGQVAWDKDGNLVGEGDYAAQAEQIVRNLDIALASAGPGLAREQVTGTQCQPPLAMWSVRLIPGRRAARSSATGSRGSAGGHAVRPRRPATTGRPRGTPAAWRRTRSPYWASCLISGVRMRVTGTWASAGVRGGKVIYSSP